MGAPLGEWRNMVDLNLSGLLYCTHAALPHLLEAAASDPRQVADLVSVSSGRRVPRSGSAVYNATKHAVGAFSEALRQEVTRRHLRVSVIEPGAVDTELVSHNRPQIQQSHRERFPQTQKMEAAGIAQTIAFIITRPRHMSINEVLVRPTEQDN